MRRRSLVAAAVVLLIVLGVLAAFLLLRDSGEDNGLASMSTRGRPIEMTVPERVGEADSAKLTGEAILIAERGGIRFVRLPRADGSSCWSAAERRSGLWQLTGYTCENRLARFPDREQPVLFVPRGTWMFPGPPPTVFASFAGFAADDVKRIGVIDVDDRLIPVANVVANVFFSPQPPPELKAVAALDEAGEVIWRSPSFTGVGLG